MVLTDMSVFNENTTNTPVSLDSMSRDVVAELENVSYFSQTVDFLIEYNKEYNDAVKTLYRSILEASGDQVVITESFDGFKNTVKKIIDKFLAFLKMIFQRFITNINSLVKSERYLKNHEKDFRKFGSQHEFDFSGYEFTISDPNIPTSNPESEWIDQIDVDFQQYAEMLEDESNGTDLAARMKTVEAKMKDNYQAVVDRLNGDYYDTLRGQILGLDTQITESNFAAELFSIFRGGSSDKDEITVNSSYVIDIFNRFKNFDETKRSIEKTRNNIETGYKNIRNELDRMMAVNGKGDEREMSLGIKNVSKASANYGTALINAGQVSDGMVTQMEQYKKAKINQVQQMSNIHALAFGAKLDAAKDMFNQDKAVLYKALYHIQGMPKEKKD